MTTPGQGRARRHVVMVEAYTGLVEPLTDEPEGRMGAMALGLPVPELANAMDARFTLLTWEPWLELERRWQLFTTWTPLPATRSTEPPPPAPAIPSSWNDADHVRIQPIAATDPGDGRPLAVRKPSLRGFGLLADNDPLAYLGYRLARELEKLHARDPVDLIILPMWGGLGGLPQLERATGVPGAPNVPTVVVVTDTSARRQIVNEEGVWTRESVSRRQMEDLSLALADGVVVFGARGAAIARAGRLHDAPSPIEVPRRIPETTLKAIAERAAAPETIPESWTLLLYGALTPASGALAMLDAVRRLTVEGGIAPQTVHCSGFDTHFAPMAPRTFRDYWSSRAWVAELEDGGWWRWSRERHASDHGTIRLFVDPWAHLPEVWSELARGSMVLLSPATAEGLAPDATLPALALLDDEPDAEIVAAALRRLLAATSDEIERARTLLCEAVTSAQSTAARQRALERAAARLTALFAAPLAPQPLDRVAQLLLDRRSTLRLLDEQGQPRTPPTRAAGTRSGTLTVAIPCHDLGPLVRETVESVWASSRTPDELIVVDDGSRDTATHRILGELETEARQRGLPFRLIRQRNRGLAGARNAALEAAMGEFIAFLDGDDVIEPAFFRIAQAVLERWTGIGGVAAWSVIFDEEGVTGHWNAPQPELPLQLVENCVFVPLLVRTQLLRELGGVDERQRYNYEDWESSCRLLCSGWPIITIPAYLQRYRVRKESLFRTMTPVQNQVMREMLLGRHRECAQRFAVELSMLIEHRLARRLYASAEQPRPPGMLDLRRWLRVGEGAMKDIARLLRSNAGQRPGGERGGA